MTLLSSLFKRKSKVETHEAPSKDLPPHSTKPPPTPTPPDAVSLYNSPRAILRTLMDLAVHKSEHTLDQRIILALMAGALIGFGTMISNMSADIPASLGGGTGLQRLIAGITFPTGIILVVFTGADLFTSNCLYFPLASLIERKISVWRLLHCMAVTWICNFAGACFVGFFFVWLPQAEQLASDPESLPLWLTDYTVHAAEKKANDTWYSTIIAGIGCNVMVCLSIWMGAATRDGAGKILGIFVPIASFVIMGFQHCIANGFTVPVGMMFGADISLWGLLKNLSLATLGNIIGGAIFVGLALYYSHVLREDNQDAVKNAARKIAATLRKNNKEDDKDSTAGRTAPHETKASTSVSRSISLPHLRAITSSISLASRGEGEEPHVLLDIGDDAMVQVYDDSSTPSNDNKEVHLVDLSGLKVV